MKAIVYGGGNIGRGFIGLLFRQTDYEVTFIDVAAKVVDGLNERHAYPVRILSNTGYEDIFIDHVCAIDGNKTDAVANAIAEADIMATAVGVNVLAQIVPNLAAGIRKRFASTDKPLNIILCENLLDADKILAGMIRTHLTDAECALFDERIGLVEASIGRMVPVQTQAMQDGDPLRVCVERYGWLPVDKDTFKGDIPDIRSLIPFSPFDFYIKRKLFVHNLSHSICAYLGLYSGYVYIWQAIGDPEIMLIVKNAMLESACALCSEYAVSMQELLPHIDDLLLRFRNRALADTCARVGGDPVRKLGPNDRLIGAARLCEKHSIIPHHITAGVAAAVHRCLYERGQAQNSSNALRALSALSGFSHGEPMTNLVMKKYALFMVGTRPEQLRNMIDELRDKEDSNVV